MKLLSDGISRTRNPGEPNRSTNFFSSDQIELGTACGKLFRCSTMAVLDAGDSDILSREA